MVHNHCVIIAASSTNKKFFYLVDVDVTVVFYSYVDFVGLGDRKNNVGFRNLW